MATVTQSPTSSIAAEDLNGGGKPAVVATATQSPTLSGHVAAEDFNGGGKPAVVATAAQSPTGKVQGRAPHHIRGKPHP